MIGKILSVIALLGVGAIAGVFLVPQLREAVSPAQSCADFVQARRLGDTHAQQHAARLIPPLIDSGADRLVVSIYLTDQCAAMPTATVDAVVASMVRTRGIAR